jgi:hypothetical protein|tara:strand:+ start:108 stop:281 length:174 start_codon:yes stop_codon:yes gene_type:complete
VGHDYYDKDAVFNSYMKEMAHSEGWEEPFTTMTVDEDSLGPDVLLTVERVNEQVQTA